MFVYDFTINYMSIQVYTTNFKYGKRTHDFFRNEFNDYVVIMSKTIWYWSEEACLNVIIIKVNDKNKT